MVKGDLVPVGKDQESHVEITREIAKTFNKMYGNVASPAPSAKAPYKPTNINNSNSQIEKNEAEAIELMKEYGFHKEDVDILNHLSYTNKIKAKTVSQIKKCVSAAQNQSKSS